MSHQNKVLQRNIESLAQVGNAENEKLLAVKSCYIMIILRGHEYTWGNTTKLDSMGH